MRFVAISLLCLPALFAQPNAPLTAAQRQARDATEKELEQIAVVDRKVMVPMRDGKRMAADIYRPRNAAGKVPVIFVRTPYDFNFWDVRNGAPRDMHAELEAVKRGYAYVEMNERGHFFSEGNYDILGPPLTDGTDAISWMAGQPWSNGKVGTIGCSSTAEWQLGVAAQGNPAFAAMIPQGFGAGVGRVKPYYEQGNWYRGGAVQMLFISWIYGEQNQVRPMFPPNTSQQDLIAASRLFDLAAADAAGGLVQGAYPSARKGHPEGGERAARHFCRPHGSRDGRGHDRARSQFSGVVPRRAVARRYADQRARASGSCPGTTFPSARTWRLTTTCAGRRGRISRREQYAVIAPTLHCSYTRATEHTVVGERDMGDARLDYSELTYGWFDHFLKGEDNQVLEKMPKVRYYTMGLNKWQTADTWPPAGAQPMTLFLASGGKANSLTGDGALAPAAPGADHADGFTYDPMNPVPSYGGNVCCTGNAVTGGAFDQRKMEARADILVYTSEPLKEGIEASGPIEATLYLSSDAKDTDVTVKLVDVYPDGIAYNLDETIQRVRYRERLRAAGGVDGAGQGLQSYHPAHDHEQLFRGGTPDSRRGIEQQLSAVRPQPEHGRQQLRRSQRSGGAQRDSSLAGVSLGGDFDGGEALKRGSATSALFHHRTSRRARAVCRPRSSPPGKRAGHRGP